MRQLKYPVAILATLMICGITLAADAPPTVTVVGKATENLKPDSLRMILVVFSEGTDIRDATAKLKSQRDAIKAKLIEAGASDASIHFQDPMEGDASNTQDNYRYMRQQSRKPPSTQPAPTKVSTILTADWPLAAGSPDDVLIASTELKTKIKAALPKADAAAPKTPEEEEVAEEMAMQRNGDPDASPTDPRFFFVHKITDDERTKLVGQAFADAEAQALRLAKASGRSSVGTPTITSNGPELNYMQQQLMMMGRARSDDLSNDAEATGDQQGTVTYAILLTVSFQMN